MDKRNLNNLTLKSYELRLEVLKMLYKARSGHPGGSLSCAEIITYLYYKKLRIKPEKPNWSERDRFILSKGHAAPIVYAALADRGFFNRDKLNYLRKINSMLQGHPDMRKTPGVDFSTGCLGEGLSIALGISLGGRLLKKNFKVFKVYVLLGDGELNEGQVWEAVMSCCKFKPDNLIVYIDKNGLQLDGFTKDVMPMENIKAKFESFGWTAFEINGHSLEEIDNATKKIEVIKGPKVIIAKTIKGKGVSFMENNYAYHGKTLDEKEFKKAETEIKLIIKKIKLNYKVYND